MMRATISLLEITWAWGLWTGERSLALEEPSYDTSASRVSQALLLIEQRSTGTSRVRSAQTIYCSRSGTEIGS
jgi:hypothetical protein